MKNTNGTYDYSCTRYDYSPVHAPFVDCWQVPVPGSAGGTGNGGHTIVASGGGGGGGAGGTNGKVVVAVYPFTAIEDGDLTLAKGEEYIVLDDSQVWSLTQFYSVDFSKSRIGVKKCVFNKRTIKVCVSCC